MNGKITDIMQTAAPSFGVCRFDSVRDKLIDCRAKRLIPDNAKSVITAVFPYLLEKKIYENSNISKYAVVKDYHSVISERLEKSCEKLREEFPDESFVCFADNSPIPEVYCAALCSLGVIGDNGLLITPDYGSYVFIGEIVTSLPCFGEETAAKGCLHCGKCAKACPSKALDSKDFGSCLSAVTQKKGDLSEDEQSLIVSSGCAWGCDVCQSVCPMNSHVKLSEIEEFILSAVPVVDADSPIEGRAFAWRGKKVIERNLALFETDN